MRVIIDKYSGFCFGVVYAIQMAESILKDAKFNDLFADQINELMATYEHHHNHHHHEH